MLRIPPTLDSLVGDTLDAADARADRVLATTPHPDPASRDPRLAGQAAVTRLLNEHRARETAAGVAAQRAWEATGKRGWLTAGLTAIGITTPTQRVVDRLHEDADAAALVARVRAPERSDLEAARSRGAADARRAAREQANWEARPDVVRAKEELRLSELVREGVHCGDPALTAAVLRGDVGAARHIVREREEAASGGYGGPCSTEVGGAVDRDWADLSEGTIGMRSPLFP